MPHPAQESASPTLLEQHLAANEDACPMCGYNLHNLRGNKCPECGQELTLQIALAEPRMAAFVTGLVGLAAGAGFAGFALLLTTIESILFGYWEWLATLLLVVETIILSLLVIAWCRRSGKIRRLSSAARWKLAAAAWLISILGLVIFGLVVWM